MTIGVVILNWRNAEETIQCLASVELLEDDDHITYVVDNGSDDGSVESLEVWMGTRPPLQGQTDLEIGTHRFVLIRSRTNRGYAGGNNLGIAAALADGCEGVWILNNDTRPQPTALTAIRRTASENSNAGVIGSCLVEYEDPETIQCLGGASYSWVSSRTQLLGRGTPVAGRHDVSIERLSFISGAAMYLSRDVIRQVGLLDERYFLFCEEMDFAERCRAHGRLLYVSFDSIVRHKFGASLGSNRSIKRRSVVAAYHATRSVMLLTRRHRPWLIPPVVVARMWLGVVMAVRGAMGASLATWRGLVAGLVQDEPDLIEGMPGVPHGSEDAGSMISRW